MAGHGWPSLGLVPLLGSVAAWTLVLAWSQLENLKPEAVNWKPEGDPKAMVRPDGTSCMVRVHIGLGSRIQPVTSGKLQ